MEFGKQKQKKRKNFGMEMEKESVRGRGGVKESTNEMKLSKDIWCPIENNIHAHKPQHINTLTQLRKAKTHSNTHTYRHILSYTHVQQKGKETFCNDNTKKTKNTQQG